MRLYAPSETQYLYTAAASESDEGSAGTEKTESKSTSNPAAAAAGGAAAPAAGEAAAPAASRYERRVNVSGVGNVETADLATFPLLAKAQYTEAVLKPGDSLYMPAGTWHYMRSLSASMSVNFWF